MRAIGFVRQVTLGKGRHATTLHHEVMSLPEVNAAELQAAHADIVDMTPNAVADACGETVPMPARHTALHISLCPTCRGMRRMTACRTCGGSGKVMAIR
jgi:hypothetical protein